jgi:hypothetical protein
VENRAQYYVKRVPRASSPEALDPEEQPSLAELRLATRVTQFAKLIQKLREVAFCASELEASALTRIERDCHARIAGLAHDSLVKLLNDSTLGRQLRQASVAKDARPL